MTISSRKNNKIIMDQNYWNGKKILITGAGGFIGSHLVEALVRNGVQARVFVRYNSRNDPGLLSLVSPEVFNQVELIGGDLRDLPAILSASKGMDMIFHLGALISIPYSYRHPAEVVESNILGTLNILLAGRENQVQRIIHTSTSEVYGTAIRVPIDENHPLQGQSPYSASKIGADKLAESFYRAYNVPVVTVRPFNTYGPRQSARAVIPTIITQAITQNEVHLGNLDATRDFTFVSDSVSGFLCAGKTPGIEGETFNLGTGSEVRIGELANMIFSIIGKQPRINVEGTRLRPEKSEVQRLLSDNRLATRRLGWTPQVDLTSGLKQTIAWISEHIQHYQPQKYQI